MWILLFSWGPTCSYFSRNSNWHTYSASQPTTVQKQTTNKMQHFWQWQRRRWQTGRRQNSYRLGANRSTNTTEFYYNCTSDLSRGSQTHTILARTFVTTIHILGECTAHTTLSVQKGLSCVPQPWCKHEQIIFPTKLVEIWKILVFEREISLFWKTDKPSF